MTSHVLNFFVLTYICINCRSQSLPSLSGPLTFFTFLAFVLFFTFIVFFFYNSRFYCLA